MTVREPRVAVATLLPQKKLRKIRYEALQEACAPLPVHVLSAQTALGKLVAMTSTGGEEPHPHQSARHYDKVLVLHKMGDFKEMTEEARCALLALPRVLWLDPPGSGAVLGSRLRMVQIMREFAAESRTALLKVDVPETESLRPNSSVAFSREASVLKPEDACGDHDSHQMIFLPRNTVFHTGPTLYIRQPFIEHAPRVIYKVYVIGSAVHVLARKSLGAERTDGDHSEPFSSAQLKDEPVLVEEHARAMAAIEPYRADLEQVALQLSRKCGLCLLGIDVLFVRDTAYLIDLNYFPGYDGVPDLPRRLAQSILDALNK